MANFNDFDLDLQTQKAKKDVKGQEVKSPLYTANCSRSCHNCPSYNVN